MENAMIAKKEPKQTTKKNSVSAIRVSKATGKVAKQLHEEANNKDWGKSVKMDRLVAKALSKLTQGDIKELQESSLSHEDRFDRDYAAYCAEHGKIPRDEYFGMRLSGQVSAISEGESAKKKA